MVRKKISEGTSFFNARRQGNLLLKLSRVGNRLTVHDLKKLLVAKEFDVLFLCEINLKSTEFKYVLVKCKMNKCFVVDVKGCKGGLAILWKEGVDTFRIFRYIMWIL